MKNAKVATTPRGGPAIIHQAATGTQRDRTNGVEGFALADVAHVYVSTRAFVSDGRDELLHDLYDVVVEDPVRAHLHGQDAVMRDSAVTQQPSDSQTLIAEQC